MSTYRPNYDNYPSSYHDLPPPPPSPEMPPLPRGPPPPPHDMYRGVDSWRPPQGPQYPMPQQNNFSFRNTDTAPKYPREEDYHRPARSRQYAMQDDSRARRNDKYNDTRNVNAPRRGNYSQGRRSYRVAPSDRPLLMHRDGEETPEQMLGMADEKVGVRKFMAAEDLSDSDEELIDESESEPDIEGANPLGSDDGRANDGAHELPIKRRTLASNSQQVADGNNVPKWSNPDPYTVLPPLDEAQRKKKDVVKLIRKARNTTEEKTAEKNQVAANDDFISFGFEDERSGMADQVPSSPSSDQQAEHGLGVPGAPPAPRRFTHLENLHSQGPGDAPGTYGKVVSIDKLGPPPGLTSESPRTSEAPAIPEKVVLDMESLEHHKTLRDHPPNGYSSTCATGPDGALGSRKRTYDDVIKDDTSKAGGVRRRGNTANRNGTIVQEWLPGPETDPTPWLFRTDKLTANAGFRLHKEICDFYEFVKPQAFEQNVREELLFRLQDVIGRQLPNCSVHCFGSFAAGLYLPNADMDVVVISESFRAYGQKVVCQTNSQMHRLGQFIKTSGLAKPGSVDVILHAKVPLVKFVDRVTEIRVDMSFENDTGIIANGTFAAWKRQFPAMPILVTVIKQFLMMRGLNEVMHGGLGGFSVTCLVTSLLQNMPRVQTGEIIPERNLGEILVEFLDFYGNRLDSTRTGILMSPPGYFDKHAYDRPNFRGPTYKANKADRLAIIDPNKPDNDISGGSNNVMLIFDRFSRARTEILEAMKSSSRPSFLDWSLGGNYDSFVWQRNHLRNLYKERWGTPGHKSVGVPDLYQGSQDSIPTSLEPLDGMRGSTLANKQDVILEAVPSSNNENTRSQEAGNPLDATGERSPKNPTSKKPKPITAKAITIENQLRRAAELRKMYPDMKEIPARLGRGTKKKLVTEYLAARKQEPSKAKKLVTDHLGGRKHEPSKAKKLVTNHLGGKKHEPSKAHNRAANLKAQYPDMKGIPSKVSKKVRQKLLANYQTCSTTSLAPASSTTNQNSAGPATRQSARLAQLTARPLPPPLRQSPNQANELTPRRRPSTRSRSYRMAPMSDERRAEVARNIGGTSNDDPITID